MVVGWFEAVILVLRPSIIQIDFNGLFIVFTGLMVAIQNSVKPKIGYDNLTDYRCRLGGVCCFLYVKPVCPLFLDGA